VEASHVAVDETETHTEAALDCDLPESWIYPHENELTGRHELRLDIICHSSYEAITASMIVDEWAGVENDVCKKCNKMFEKTSKRDRFFCSQLCGKQYHKREARRKVADKRHKTTTPKSLAKRPVQRSRAKKASMGK
jgi:hypothetical protein